MTATTAAPRRQTDEDVSRRLLESAESLSYDPLTEVDWESPLDPDLYGMSPEWSTLYGTRLWDEMTEQQRVTLTRHEATSIASTGIWFEMILQQMMLRDQYVKDPTDAEFQWALTEIADECRHSIMFARGAEKMGINAYIPKRVPVELARAFKSLAAAESAYGGILVAEEVLDVMQRDWMRDERVLPMVRTVSNIHVVEESRHMKFARQEIRERMEGVSRSRRWTSSVLIASTAYVIVSSLVNDGVYAAAGLDTEQALREARGNEYHKSLMRSSCAHLMSFLREAGLLTRPATALYRRVDMI